MAPLEHLPEHHLRLLEIALRTLESVQTLLRPVGGTQDLTVPYLVMSGNVNNSFWIPVLLAAVVRSQEQGPAKWQNSCGFAHSTANTHTPPSLITIPLTSNILDSSRHSGPAGSGGESAAAERAPVVCMPQQKNEREQTSSSSIHMSRASICLCGRLCSGV